MIMSKLLLLTEHIVPKNLSGIIFPQKLLDEGKFLNFGVHNINYRQREYDVADLILAQMTLQESRALASVQIGDERNPLSILEEVLKDFPISYHPNDMNNTSVLFGYTRFNAIADRAAVTAFPLHYADALIRRHFQSQTAPVEAV